MLDSIYHMTLKLLKNCIFGVKMSRFSLILRKVIMDVITFPENRWILLHVIISLPDLMHVINKDYIAIFL